MHKLFLALLTVAPMAFQSTSFAKSECVPTQTVEEAQAEYQAGLNAISAELAQSFADSKTQCENSNDALFAKYNATRTEIDARYDQEIADIRAHLDLGWNEQMDAAVDRHNKAQYATNLEYTNATQAQMDLYNQNVEQAMSDYNIKAAVLADHYNTSVCAVRAK